MLSNIVAFFNMAQQVVEHTSQSDNKITWSIIKDNLGEQLTQLTRMKFVVRIAYNNYNCVWCVLTLKSCIVTILALLICPLAHMLIIIPRVYYTYLIVIRGSP